MALIEEVWGDLSTSSPPAPKTEPPQSNDIPKREIEIKEEEEVVKENFVNHKKNNSLALFLSLVVVGGCSIYALDYFTKVVRS